MTRERLELENALHDIQTQLEQAKQVKACVTPLHLKCLLVCACMSALVKVILCICI